MSSWVLACLTRKRALSLGLALFCLGGCARAFELKDIPPSFIEVGTRKATALRMKGPGDIQLRIAARHNRRRSTLEGADYFLTRRRDEEGYVLTTREPVTSANGVPGIRFDFSLYSIESFSQVLFVTDKWQVLVYLHGEPGQIARHGEDIDRLLAEIEIRGCKARNTACNGDD